MHDPLAALRPADIEVELGGWLYVITARPAADWMVALMKGPAAIVPGMLASDDRAELLRDFLRGRVTQEEMSEAAHDVLEAASGRRWWEAERLVVSAMQGDSWPVVHGELVLRGVDLEKISLGALWNALYSLVIQNTEEAKRPKIEFEISKPPPGVSADELYDPEDAEDSFMAALAHEQRMSGGGALPSAEAP